MTIYHRRQRRARVRWTLSLWLAAGLAVGSWWVFWRGNTGIQVGDQLALNSQIALTSDRPEVDTDSSPNSGVSEKGATPRPLGGPRSSTPTARRAESLIDAGKKALERGDLVAARTHFSEAISVGVHGSQMTLLSAELTRLGNQTIFSPRILKDDPLTAGYILQSGDNLGAIAKANKVSADLLAAINGIKNKNRIRAGRSLKIVKGPFRAVVSKSDYSLDVYLGSTFVKRFKVGLGADGSTPTGDWQVTTKLTNPTYYPPRGGSIVAADDPQNPLGERWIGLQGVSGEALGQHRYGIHGTIDADSIGKSVSLGCIRLYNEDAESLYDYLIETHSTVKVLD